MQHAVRSYKKLNINLEKIDFRVGDGQTITDHFKSSLDFCSVGDGWGSDTHHQPYNARHASF